MKTFILLLASICSTIAIQLNAQDLKDSRIAYSYVYAAFDHQIAEDFDKSKLSSKEEKLNKKFRKKLDNLCLSAVVENVNNKMAEHEVNMSPLDAITAIKPFGLHGYPAIAFPKKTLRKNVDKNVADYFLSANLSINKPLVALAGFKPEAIFTVKLFSKDGIELKKIKKSVETEKKISGIGFATKQSESFSKIDYEHAQWLYDRIEPAIQGAIAEAIEELLVSDSVAE